MKRTHFLLLLICALAFSVSCAGCHGPQVAYEPKGPQTTPFGTVLRDIGAGAVQSQRLRGVAWSAVSLLP